LELSRQDDSSKRIDVWLQHQFYAAKTNDCGKALVGAAFKRCHSQQKFDQQGDVR
jgi:hypothetical protein